MRFKEVITDLKILEDELDESGIYVNFDMGQRLHVFLSHEWELRCINYLIENLSSEGITKNLFEHAFQAMLMLENEIEELRVKFIRLYERKFGVCLYEAEVNIVKLIGNGYYLIRIEPCPSSETRTLRLL